MLFKEFSGIYEKIPSFLILLVSCSSKSNHEIKTWIQVLHLVKLFEKIKMRE